MKGKQRNDRKRRVLGETRRGKEVGSGGEEKERDEVRKKREEEGISGEGRRVYK